MAKISEKASLAADWPRDGSTDLLKKYDISGLFFYFCLFNTVDSKQINVR